jgi:hypothetical protein
MRMRSGMGSVAGVGLTRIVGGGVGCEMCGIMQLCGCCGGTSIHLYRLG